MDISRPTGWPGSSVVRRQEFAQSLQTLFGNAVDIVLAGADISEMRRVQPLENLLVTGFGVVGARIARGHCGEGANGQQHGGSCGAAGFRQACEGAVHKEHNETVGNQHQEGGDEQGRAQRFRRFADQCFAGGVDTGERGIERAKRGASR